MKGIKIKINKWIVGLVFLFFVYFFANALVLSKDNFYPLYDSLNTVMAAFRLANAVLSGEIASLNLIFDSSSPLMCCLLMLNIILFNGNIDALMLTNLLFLIILIYSLYQLGKRIYDESVGFASVVVCLSFPAVFGTSRIMWHEFPLMCIIALSYYLLFKTNYFLDKKYTLLWSLAVSCGLLIKFTLPLYIMFPVFIYMCMAFIRRKDRKRLAQILLACFLIVLALTGWWYLSQIGSIIETRLKMFSGTPIDLFNQIKLACFFLADRSIYLPLFFIFIISLPIMLIKPTFEKFIIISGIVVPTVLFIINPCEGGFDSNRYFVPILPLIALSIANIISLFSKKSLRYLIFFILISLCSAQFLLVNIGLGDIVTLSIDRSDNVVQDIIEQGKIVPYAPKADFRALLNLLDKRKTEKEISVLFLGDFPRIDAFLQIEIMKKGERWERYNPINEIMGMSTKDIWDDIQLLEAAEFVIALEEDWYDDKETDTIYNTTLIPKISSFFKQKRAAYEKIGSFESESGHEIVVFQKFKDY